MFRKKSIIGVTGLFATLLTGQALAVEGQYTDNTRYWSRTYDKSYGHSKINVSLNYHNRAEMFHTGLTSYMANQHVKARTSFTLKANGLGTSRTLLEASVAGQSVNYHNSNTDSYQASGLIKLEGND